MIAAVAVAAEPAGLAQPRPLPALAYLRRLPGLVSADPNLARLIAALDSEDFEAREQATRELARLGGSAELALRAALETQARYIGMIGSPGKIKNIFRHLLEDGISRERLAEVHTPIGLDLGAETPDEIALSIAAEMVMIRKNGSGAPLKSLHHFLDELEAPAEAQTVQK